MRRCRTDTQYDYGIGCSCDIQEGMGAEICSCDIQEGMGAEICSCGIRKNPGEEDSPIGN